MIMGPHEEWAHCHQVAKHDPAHYNAAAMRENSVLTSIPRELNWHGFATWNRCLECYHLEFLLEE